MFIVALRLTPSLVIAYGLQPQVIKKQLVPWEKKVEALVLDLARIKHGAAAEALPEDPDMPTGNRHRRIRKKHDRDKRHEHQVDDDAGEIAVDKSPPPRTCRCGRRR
jgi:hypothetical protein